MRLCMVTSMFPVDVFMYVCSFMRALHVCMYDMCIILHIFLHCLKCMCGLLYMTVFVSCIHVYIHVIQFNPLLHGFSSLSNLQCICSGAFKFRGALNAIFSLSEREASNGVLTHSRLKLQLIG
jgi:hypothetical protein